MIKHELRSGYRNRSQESTIFLVSSSYFSSYFKFCVCLSNKSGMFVMKSVFLVSTS